MVSEFSMAACILQPISLRFEICRLLKASVLSPKFIHKSKKKLVPSYQSRQSSHQQLHQLPWKPPLQVLWQLEGLLESIVLVVKLSSHDSWQWRQSRCGKSSSKPRPRIQRSARLTWRRGILQGSWLPSILQLVCGPVRTCLLISLLICLAAIKTSPEVQLETGEGGSGVGIIVEGGAESQAATPAAAKREEKIGLPIVSLLKVRTLGDSSGKFMQIISDGGSN
ncbi:hypothetical protein BJ878DRAFT_136203 [Calycina marina]|uniref:Uncharacterized protein n=1 Tax=Calycina marina TaxID=1763456 RepID=A0A9P8CDT5_9HELO|nr:hypothetical protein BJ878DRAFT_136203 [Calycina marina]